MKIENKTNIIFLDIDGCLTSAKDDNYFNPDKTKYHPSKNTISKLINLCKETNSKIILSSNWRKFEIDGVWKNKYGTYHNPISETIKLFGEYCIGTLPPTRHINKSKALILWLDEQTNLSNFNFVVFDDDVDEEFQNTYEYKINEHFIFVDNYYGIIDRDLQLAKKILTKNN